MLDLKLWSLEKNDQDKFTPAALDNLVQTQTEQQLEELIVENPDLLFNGLKLVGRQTSTHTGALDLLGVDQDGRLVVFELKKTKTSLSSLISVIISRTIQFTLPK